MKIKAISSLFGGALFGTVLIDNLIYLQIVGSIYLWGNIIPYVVSNLKQYDESSTYSDFYFMVPSNTLGFNIGMLFGESFLYNKFGPKLYLEIY